MVHTHCPHILCFIPMSIPQKDSLINTIQRGESRAVYGFGYFCILPCDWATAFWQSWVVGACLLLAGLRGAPPVAPCYSPHLLCLPSWLSGRFITSVGPFKLISLVPLVGELGNCLPEHRTERCEGTVTASREAVAELGLESFSFSSAVVVRGGTGAVLLLTCATLSF